MDDKVNGDSYIEKEIDELGEEIVKIKINRNKHKNKQQSNNKIKEEKNSNDINNISSNVNENNVKNQISKEININSNSNSEKKEEFNLDSFNNFVKQNINIQSSSSNNNQIKSHLKTHLKIKLNLGLGLKKQESSKNEVISKNIIPQHEQDNLNNNININYENKKKENNNESNEDNLFQNININHINEEENLKKNTEQTNIKNINDQNYESSFLLKQKFNKMNESQISYEANTSINHLKDHKVKKKFKLSLYNLQKLSLLGAGASGEVYLVQDTETKKKLALKTVKYTEDEKEKSQIETEVNLSTLLKHENIIRIYATYFLKGRINFVMEYMDKGTIADILKKIKKIPEKFVGLIAYQVVKGMTFCQKEKRIIHRDLKPSNILVNSKGEIKIADFGVSTIVEGSWAQKKTMIGTYIYMAPERIDADLYYINCDVWSLGIIIMECILGFYPYIIYNNNALPNSVWVVHELIENNPVPQLDKKIYSLELIDFKNKCLIKDPKKRPTPAQLMEHPFLQKYSKLSKEELANWIRNIN